MANRTVEPATGLSYRDTDQSAAGPNFHPLIQQKRLVTGQRKGDTPQAVRAWAELGLGGMGRDAWSMHAAESGCRRWPACHCPSCLPSLCHRAHFHSTTHPAPRLNTCPCARRLPCRCPQIKQYRGVPFKARARGIFNATGLNEGIVFVSGQQLLLPVIGCVCYACHAPPSRHSLLRCRRASDHAPPLPATFASNTRVVNCCGSAFSCAHPQGSNFDTSEEPTQYESSLERPVTTIFTGMWGCCAAAAVRLPSSLLTAARGVEQLYAWSTPPFPMQLGCAAL